jgi:8-oxo-dGTP pyrophosphatase MutT (NUDIX family)
MENKQEILPAIAVIIFNEQGEVLLQRRKDVNQWCLLSGHVEFGETITEAVLREVVEETGAPCQIVRFIGLYSGPSSQTYYYDERTVQYITAYFEVKFMQPVDLSFSNNETRELRYFSPSAIPSELAQINPDWLQDALSTQHAPFLR